MVADQGFVINTDTSTFDQLNTCKRKKHSPVREKSIQRLILFLEIYMGRDEGIFRCNPEMNENLDLLTCVGARSLTHSAVGHCFDGVSMASIKCGGRMLWKSKSTQIKISEHNVAKQVPPPQLSEHPSERRVHLKLTFLCSRLRTNSVSATFCLGFGTKYRILTSYSSLQDWTKYY